MVDLFNDKPKAKEHDNPWGIDLRLDDLADRDDGLDGLELSLSGLPDDGSTAIIERAVSGNPDQHQKTLDIAEKSGLPAEVIERDNGQVERTVKGREIREKLKDSEALNEWFLSQENARIAHDDIDALKGIESALTPELGPVESFVKYGENALKRGVLRSESGLAQFVAEESREQAKDSDMGFMDILRDETYKVAPGRDSGLPFAIPSPLDLYGAVERFVTSRAFDKEDAEQDAQAQTLEVGRINKIASGIEWEPESKAQLDYIHEQAKGGLIPGLAAALENPYQSFKIAAQVMGEMAPQLTTATAVTAVTRNPALGAASMGALSYGTERFTSPAEFLASRGVDLTDPESVAKALRDDGLMGESQFRGFSRGVTIGSLDAASGFVAGKALSESFFANMLGQTLTQASLGGGGEAYAQYITDDRIDWGEVVLEMLGEMATTPIEVVGVGRQYFPEVMDKIRSAAKDSEILNSISKKSQESKLKQRAKARFSDYVKKVSEKYGTESVFVEPIEAEKLFQDSNIPEEILKSKAVQKIIADIPKAIESGNDIEVPLGDYAADIMGSPIEEALSPHVRLDPAGFTPAEAENVDIQAEIEEAAAIEIESAEQRQQESIILEARKQEYVNAGLDTGAAETVAAIDFSVFEAQAERIGVPVQEIALQYGAAVTREVDPTLIERASVIDQLDIQLDLIRSGEVPSDSQIYGETALQAVVANGGLGEGLLEVPGGNDGLTGNNRIFRETGMNLDQAREFLQQNGFIEDGGTTEEVLDIVRDELAGNPKYRAGGENVEGLAIRQELDELQAILAEAGIDPLVLSNDEIRRALSPATGEVLEQGKRGYYVRDENKIVFTKNSDLSTVIHELGHSYLDMLRDLAPESQEVQSDLNMLENWFIDSGAKHDRSRHEMFASGFEEYLREGKAPTTALQAVFSRVRQWMVLVYETFMKNTPFGANRLESVSLNDEVRAVFDRLVAANSAIKESRESFVYDDMPIDTMGLADEQAAEYRALKNQAKDQARDELTAKVMADLSREKKKQFKSAVNQKAEEIAESLESEPVYQLRDHITGDRQVAGIPAEKLNYDSVALVLGKKRADTLAKEGIAKKGGMQPDIMAGHFGYYTGGEMLADLANSMGKKKRRAYINAAAVAAVREEQGDTIASGRISQEADEAVHTDKQAQLLELELRILNEKAGARFATKGTPKTILAKFRESARIAVASIPIEKLRPDRYRSLEQKYGRAAYRLAAQGKFAEAREQKHNQISQFMLYRESTKARKTADRYQSRLRQMQKTKYNPREVAPEYIQQLKVLLAAYDLRSQPTRSGPMTEQVKAFVKAQAESNPDLIAATILDNITSWKEMTLEQLQAVRDAAQNIYTIGKSLSEKERIKFSDETHELSMSILQKMGTPTPKDTNVSRASLIKSGWKQFFSAAHRKLESFLQELDGWGDNGPMAEAIFRPLWEAQVQEVERGRLEHDELAGLFEGYDHLFSAFKADLQTLGYEGKAVDLHHIPVGGSKTRALSRAERVVLALNWGNEGNREAILNQNEFEMSEADILEAIGSLDESELALVNRVWEYVDKFYPEIARIEKEVTGVAPAKVEAKPFSVNGIDMRGGYYPLMSDPALSIRAETQEVEERAKRMMMGGGGMRASTKHGSSIERKGFGGGTVRLDLDGLFRHVDGVIHDITHRQAVRKVDRLLRSPSVRDAAISSIGQENYKAIMQAVTRVAGGSIHPADIAIINRIARFSRVAASYGAMGYSLRTAILNTTGFIPAIAELGPVRVVSSLLQEFVSPIEFGREIKEKSTFMENRGQTINRDVNYALRQLRGNKGWNAFKAHAFTMLVKVDAFVSRAVWNSQYLASIEQGRSEKDAVFDADRTVSRTQGTSLKLDLSAVEDSNEILRMLSPMYTYFNSILNLAKRRGGKRKTGRISNSRYIADMMWILLVPALVEEAMLGGPDDDEEWKEKHDKSKVAIRYTKAAASYYAGQWFGIREMSGFIRYGQMFETPLQRVVGAPLAGVTEAAEFVFDPEKEFDSGSIRATTNLLPYLGVPTGAQANRIAKYLYEYERDGGEVTPYNVLRGVVKGKNTQ